MIYEVWIEFLGHDGACGYELLSQARCRFASQGIADPSAALGC
jgi:hypothetical protein